MLNMSLQKNGFESKFIMHVTRPDGTKQEVKPSKKQMTQDECDELELEVKAKPVITAQCLVRNLNTQEIVCDLSHEDRVSGDRKQVKSDLSQKVLDHLLSSGIIKNKFPQKRPKNNYLAGHKK